jgi:uncharacterized coiled-coil protein SlyX
MSSQQVNMAAISVHLQALSALIAPMVAPQDASHQPHGDSTEPASLEDRVRALEAQLSNQAAVLNSLNNIEGSLVAMAEATKQTNTDNQTLLKSIDKSFSVIAESANHSRVE